MSLLKRGKSFEKRMYTIETKTIQISNVFYAMPAFWLNCNHGEMELIKPFYPWLYVQYCPLANTNIRMEKYTRVRYSESYQLILNVIIKRSQKSSVKMFRNFYSKAKTYQVENLQCTCLLWWFMSSGQDHMYTWIWHIFQFIIAVKVAASSFIIEYVQIGH